MLTDPLADLMSKIMNAQARGKTTCSSRPVSKIIKKILEIMKQNNYINGYEIVEDNKGSIVSVNLNGRINKCSVIKPRFSVAKTEFEKFEKRFLPAKDFGFLIVSTSKGIMTHNEAKEKNTGGSLLAYIY